MEISGRRALPQSACHLHAAIFRPQRPHRRERAHLKFEARLPRDDALRLFLEYPSVPIDTNHLEREIRPIALGRKNWLFCWSEVGAEAVGIVQSLLATCRLQEVDPYVYLVDVVQRVDNHPFAEVSNLTPRLRKERFAATPLRSVIDRPVKNAAA